MDLKFRLYHPTENNGFTVFDEETFTLKLAVFADPMIKSMCSGKDGFMKEPSGTITVVVQNVGSAVALDVVVDLVWDGLTVSDLPSERPPMLNRTVAKYLNYSMIPFFFCCLFDEKSFS